MEKCESIHHFPKHLRSCDWIIDVSIFVLILLQFVKNSVAIFVMHSFVVIISILQHLLFKTKLFLVLDISLSLVDEKVILVEVTKNAKEAKPETEINLVDNWVLLIFLTLGSIAGVIPHSKKEEQNEIHDSDAVHHISLS